MGRAPCCEKVGLKRGRWTAEEDDILTKYIQANGEGLWRSLPKKAGLLRCGKSCRLRWINYLRSDVKRGNISAEEEEVIIKLHSSLGNRWSVIAGHLPGRTDNEIKNYWNSHLSRKIQRPSGDTPPPAAVNSAKEKGIPNKQRGGRTTRSAVKKTKTYNIPTSAQKESSEHFVNGVIPMPPTPSSLEEETLSSAISWQEEIMGDISVLVPSPLVPSPLGCSCEERESLALCSDDGKVDWNWNWDGGDEWVEEDKMLSWLWESPENGEGDCNEVKGDIDSEKQTAMVAWLLS